MIGLLRATLQKRLGHLKLHRSDPIPSSIHSFTPCSTKGTIVIQSDWIERDGAITSYYRQTLRNLALTLHIARSNAMQCNNAYLCVSGPPVLSKTSGEVSLNEKNNELSDTNLGWVEKVESQLA